MRRLIIGFMIFPVLAGAVLAGLFYVGATRWRSHEAAEVDIQPGASVRAIARMLEERKVIRTPRIFEICARARGLSGRLRAGNYEFSAGTTMIEALDKIVRGEVKTYAFTVIEGWAIKDIASALAGQPFLKDKKMPEEFLRLAYDKDYIGALGFEGIGSLEGYLFPDTYFVAGSISADALIRQMVLRFHEVWESVAGGPAAGLDMNIKETVTLASIVEKETGVVVERPLVAAVFVNRLKRGMALQSDPTIIYGLPDFDGNIRRRDISNPHPYNTYIHPGLPPGPICNPGRASLDAALHPAKTGYLYFVSKNDGSHHFTDKLSEHLSAVKKYQVRGPRGAR